MRKRVVVVLVMVGLLAGVAAIAMNATSSDVRPSASLDELPRLPIGGAAAGAERLANDAATTTAAAPSAAGASTMIARDFGIDYEIADLPDLGGKAAAYRLVADVSKDRVQSLAKALGLKGAVAEADGALVVQDGKFMLRVEQKGFGSFSYYPAAPSSDCSTSSDGSTRCSGAGESMAAIGCAVPPCPPDQACDAMAKCGTVQQPVRPADLPSKDEAERVAKAFLATAGMPMDGASVTVTDGFTQWYVSMTPKVDGHFVSGLNSGVSVGSKGAIMSANGWLGDLTKLGDYPLVGTPAAVERLKAGKVIGYYSDPAAMMAQAKTMEAAGSGPVTTFPSPDKPTAAVASDEATRSGSASGSDSGSSAGSTGSAGATTPAAPPSTVVCMGAGVAVDDAAKKAATDQRIAAPCGPVTPSERPKVKITSVRIELAFVPGADGAAVLVPAYAFQTEQGGGGPMVAAVPDDLIEQQVPAAGINSRDAIEPAPMPTPAVVPDRGAVTTIP